MYFVLDGVQRIYYYDEQEREATILFVYALSFGGVLDSFLLKIPSCYYYETLTKSSFLSTSFVQLNELSAKHKEIQSFIQKVLLLSLSGVLERLVELQCFSSEEKFKVLLNRSPHLLKLVPQKHLANYIGIDPTNFSKLMNKVIL